MEEQSLFNSGLPTTTIHCQTHAHANLVLSIQSHMHQCSNNDSYVVVTISTVAIMKSCFGQEQETYFGADVIFGRLKDE